MAFTDFSPKFKSQEAQDAKSVKIIDESTWSGEQALCTEAILEISYYDTYGVLISATAYDLIDGVDRTKFNQFLSTDGHVVPIADVLPGQERFVDGYYLLKITFDDGTYTQPNKPYYIEHQAFLAKLRCMSRKMPYQIVNWPEYDRTKLLDTHSLTLLLDNAEDAADLGKRITFEKIVRTLNRVFDKYQITGCW